MLDTAFVIQARLGSTRLANKVLLPFYKEKTILELMIEKLKGNFNIPVILATTDNPKDDVLEEFAKKLNVDFFRGSENDVLSRFTGAADKFDVKNIVRVCSDNPFISVEGIRTLLESWEDSYDYLCFATKDGTPSIKTHYGFWLEMISSECLNQINDLDIEDLYREHVTNYIYSVPNDFVIGKIAISEKIQSMELRLTTDTLTDFEMHKAIYNDLQEVSANWDVNEVLEYLENKSDFLDVMQKVIRNNKK
jgi:spore coat polysaccharide biosynthesis protein SpsF